MSVSKESSLIQTWIFEFLFAIMSHFFFLYSKLINNKNKTAKMNLKPKSVFLLAYIVEFIILNQCTYAASVTDPIITSWVQSCGMASSGSAKGILTNVLKISYDSTNVYIQATGIPSYRCYICCAICDRFGILKFCIIFSILFSFKYWLMGC